MGSTEKNVALVFGASGISGWAVAKNLLTYPTPTTFSRIIGLTNRPLSVEESGLPTDDPRLELHHGVNLREEQGAVIEQMKEIIPRIEEVTHVYYLAYSNVSAYSKDLMALRDLNVHMTSNAVHACDDLCKDMKFFTLQTGTNAYGVAVFGHQDKIEINPPLKESQARIPSPIGDEIFYYPQVDLIKECQKGKSWKWCEVRPDAIVGFVPRVSGMTFIEPTALFLALWRYVKGPGAEVPAWGTDANYRHTSTDSSQDIIARSEIYLSVVKPDEANGEAFNTADYDTPTSYVEKWPVIADYFDLKGVGPVEPAETYFPADKFWEEHQEDYKKMCAEYGLRERTIPADTWLFSLVLGHSYLVRSRHLSLDKIRSLGFNETLKAAEGHRMAFDKLAQAKIIPGREAMQKGA